MTVVVDKDSICSEIGAITRVMANANIIICPFHTIRALRKALIEKCNRDKTVKIEKTAINLVYIHTFNTRRILKKLFETLPFH